MTKDAKKADRKQKMEKHFKSLENAKLAEDAARKDAFLRTLDGMDTAALIRMLEASYSGYIEDGELDHALITKIAGVLASRQIAVSNPCEDID